MPRRSLWIGSLLAVLVAGGAADARPKRSEWRVYGGDPGGTKRSALRQIDRTNVRKLRPAWIYRCDDARELPPTTIECNPLVVDGVMYATTAQVKVVALDAATGRELWKFDPWNGIGGGGVNRGVTYWASGRDKRIFTVASTFLYALDATTGRPIESFGTGGRVDLREGLDRTPNFFVGATSPGVVYKDLLILGSTVADGPGPSGPGHIRAFDVRTGARRWIFHTIPHPGEPGYETWPPDAWKTTGGANSWGGMTLDEKRGLVFAGTGSPSYDHWGGDRIGQNLFANCVLALDAETGRRVWHFQTVHHDLWDYDVPSPPTLVTVRHGGRRIDAVAQSHKVGHLFVLDRETGEPLFPVEERPVPPSDLPGEQAWPTQPFPVRPPPFARQRFTADEVTDLSSEAGAFVLDLLAGMRTGDVFLPPGLTPSIAMPGFNGGGEWGGAAFDPATRTLYVNANDELQWISMVEAPPQSRVPYVATSHHYLRDAEGFPANTRPWGTLTAIDLDEGTIRWQVPLGTYPELERRGLPPTGTFNMGGPLVTAGGLVFIGAAKDERFHAYDKRTGELLWEFQLEAGGYATPTTYEIRGRQYVVIAAGGGGAPKTKVGNAFYAFALPRPKPRR